MKNILTLSVLLLVACSSPAPSTPAVTSAASNLGITQIAPSSEPTTLQSTPTLVIQPNTPQSAPPVSTKRPNILFVLTDDMRMDDLEVMPKLKSLVTDQGTFFKNYFLNVSLCCPSRASTLRGQYAQNTKVFTNTPPDGGFQVFHSTGDENSTIATWLHDAGYRTMLAGKYLNGYPLRNELTFVPPGWDEWYVAARGNAYSEFNYTLNENGKLVAYGNKPEDYGTDVYGRKAIDFIQRSAKEGKPFFVYVPVYAPHGPATPAPRHANLFPDAKAPRTPNFNEQDVSDKPAYIRNRAQLSTREIQRIDQDYRNRLQSLQAVDEMIANIVDILKSTGQLDNTYFFFSSDNGFHLGSHRQLEGKQAPYEEEIRVGLIVRGPNVPAGRTLDHLVGNIDLAPTWAELAGIKPPDFVDGRSLVPLLTPPLSATGEDGRGWRQAYLIQSGNPDGARAQRLAPRQTPTRTTNDGTLEPPDADEEQTQTGLLANLLQRIAGVTPYQGIRTKDYTYVEYVTSEKELYDLRSDPYQLQNIVKTANPEIVKQLAARLAELKKCSGASCRNEEAIKFNY